MRIVLENGDPFEGEFIGYTARAICIELEDGSFVLVPEPRIAHIECERHELKDFGL